MTSLSGTTPATNPTREPGITGISPTHERGAESARDALLAHVVAEYLAACRAGQHPEVAPLIAQYPEIAADLTACLASLQFLENISQQERLLARPAAEQDSDDNGRGAAFRRVEGTLGDYRILREIGRGGMGVVYEAHQISLSRRVALKVLPFAAILDERAKKRFQNEALAAAQLDHPHIVDVYGVGCERGVHYYAMRLIEGRSLAEIVQHLREQLEANPKYVPSSLADLVSTSRKTANTAADNSEETLTLDRNPASAFSSPAPSSQTPAPRPKLGPSYYRAIAALGMHVAEALDHAHEQGVLHRDIKPSNLMLDSAGKVWITDFGLAHLDSAASLTHTGDLLGTLRYMPPEQVLAKRVPSDPRSDIYSVGITLYELLTLQSAFESENRGEMLRQIAVEEPVRPRRLNPNIPSDLETIILKALEKSPSDRYATCRLLADDLQLVLERKAIKARPIGIQDRLLRLAKRHSLAIATGFALTLLVTTALGIAFAVTYKARNDAMLKGQEAMSKGQELERRHEQSIVILKRVNGTVDSMLDRLASLPAGDATRQAIIEEELAFYKGLQEIDQNNAAASDQLAVALLRMGHLQIELKRFDNAEDNLRKAIVILERRSREEPSSSMHANLLCHSWMNLGRVQRETKNDAAAFESFQQSILYGEKAMQMSPDNCEYRMALGFPWGQLGMLYSNLGKSSDARAAHEREIDLHRTNVARQPGHWQYRLVFGMANYMYARTLVDLGDRDSAAPWFQAARDTYKSLHQDRPDDWLIRSRLVTICRFRAEHLHGMERAIVDRSDLELAVALMPQDADILNLSAWLLSRHAEANHENLQRAAEWAATAVSRQPTKPNYRNTLGTVHYRQGNFPAALGELDKSRELGNSDYGYGYDAIIQAMCFEKLNQHDRAVACYLEATSWARRHSVKDPQWNAFCREATALLDLTETPAP